MEPGRQFVDHDDFNQRIDAEQARPGKDFSSATDGCAHCRRPIIWDPANEAHTAKGHDGYDCSVKGAFGHTPE